MKIVLVGLSTLAFSLITVALARRLAGRIGFVATPRKDRWHKQSTPLLGGAAIYAAFVLGYFLFTPELTGAYPILAGGTLLFITGMIDDVVHIKPYTKLVIQFSVAATLVYFGFHLPWVDYAWVNQFLTIFWLVGITNAINLLDNMDGLAGGISVIACVFLALTFMLNGQSAEALLAIILGAAVLGFLVFNFKPASIFMGDSGSMFLGFMLSGLALLSGTARFRSLTSVVLTPVLILMIPIFDTCVVVATRKLSGRRISQGGRDHTSHRLVALGVTERRAVTICYAIATISGGLALWSRWLKNTSTIGLVSAFTLAVVMLGIYLARVRVHQADEKSDGVPIFNAIASFAYKRRIFETLLDVVLVMLAYYGAYLLRWDGDIPEQQLSIFVKTLPVIIIIDMCFLLLGGVYRGLWRYVGIEDVPVIVRSVLAGSMASMLAVFLMCRSQDPSPGVFVLDLLFLLVLIIGSRLSFRLLRAVIVGRVKTTPDAKPVLIYGADDSGEHLIREILTRHGSQYAPVGFIDDDEGKSGRLLHGYRIFASNQVPELIEAYKVEEVILSSPKVPSRNLDRLRSLGLSLKMMNIRIETV